MNSMKKSVRIRKALPGETPRFINKTSKFLTKAKMGMSVSAPSSDEMIKNIVETIYTDLSYDADPDIVLSETVSKYKISEQSALMLLKIAMTRLSDEGFYDKEDIKSDAEKTEDKEKALAIANQKNKELQKQQTESDNAELDEMNFSEEGYDAEEEEERLNDRSHLEDEESMQQEAFDDGGEISEQQQIINQYAYPGKKNDKIFSLDEEIKNTPGTVPIIPGMYPELTDYIANYRPISDSFEYSKYLPEGKEGMSMETFDPACPCPPTCDCRDYGLAVKEGIPLLTKFFPETGASLARGLQGFDFINKETPIGSSTGIQRVLPLGSLAGQGVRAIPKVGKWFDPKAPQTYIVQNRLDMFKLLGGQDVTDLPSFLRNGNAIDPNSVSVKSLELLGTDIDKILKYVDAAGGATAQTNSFMLKDVDPNIDLGITNTIGGIYDGNTKIVFGLDDVSKTPFFQLERQVTPGERLVDGIVPRKANPVTFKNRFYFETMGPRQSMAIYNSNGELILNRGEKSLFSTAEPNYFTGQTQYFPSTQKPLTKEDMTFGRRLTDQLLFPRPYFRSGTLQEQVFPTLGYTAPGQQQEGFNPASLTADEILKDWQYQKNYNKRLGYKTLGYPLGLGALGYGIYKSIYPDPCPCANGTMKVECCEEKDPTTQTVGTSNEVRNVDPSTLNKTVIPDSIKRLQDNPNTRLENITDREYYEMMKKMRLRPDSINPKVPYRIGVEDIPGKEEKYGGATKNQFIKKVGGLLRKDEGGENTLGKGSRQDTLTSDVSQIKTDFIKSVNKKAGDALLSNIYEKANKTGDQGLINALMGNQEAPQARRGMAISNDDVPEWYTGYNYMLKPRQYRKYFNKLKKLLPKGLDISKLNYASSMYNSNLSRAPFGNVFTIDDYAKLLTSAAYPIKEGMEMQGPSMYVQDTDIFGRPKRYMVDFSGRMSAQRQAEQVEETNNKKNIDALSLPIILQNPGYDGIMPPSQTGIDFTNDKSVFLNWSQTPTQPQGLPGPEVYYNQGGFVDMDVENPLTRFIYGGDPCPEGSYWNGEECVPYAPGVPTREELFNDPTNLDYLNKLNRRRNVQDYDKWRENKLNEYIKQNYKGPRDSKGNVYTNEEWFEFLNSEEFQKLNKSLPNPEDEDGPLNFPKDYEQKNYYPKEGDWDEKSKKELNDLFNSEADEYEILRKFLEENPDYKEEYYDKGFNYMYNKLTPEQKSKYTPKTEELRKSRYDNWCPCSKTQEILVQGKPVQQKICVPCEQAKTGGYINRNSKNSLTKFGYGGDETDYYEPYSLPEANGGLSVSGQKCPPGYGFSKSQNKCVPFKPKRTYVPVTIPNRRDYGFRGMLPWNPMFSNVGSWSKQMRLPYYLNNNQLYTGQLPSSPMARYVTDTDIFGRDKRYLDIYEVGEGDNLSDLYDFIGSQNINTQNNNRQQTRQKSSGDRLDRRIARWDRRAARNEEEYEPMEGAITNYENPDDFYNAINPVSREDAQFLGAGYTAAEDYKNKGKVRKVRDAEGNWYDRNDKMIPDKKAPSEVPGYYDPVKKHGGLHKYAPGGINDPSPGGYNPFALGTGFGMGFGQSTSAYDPQSADARFERELQGGAGPSKLPPQQQNPFAFITGTGTGSYAETANTGHTLGSQGQEIIPQKVSPNNKRNLVGVESKRKIMREVNPQGMVDVKNNMIISPITMAIENRGRKQNEINTTLDFTSANMNYPAANEIYQGKDVDYGSGIGMFTPEQGSDRSSYSTFGRYGGYMAYGGFADPYFEEDEEVYMTPEELEQFLAAGGQVEYL